MIILRTRFFSDKNMLMRIAHKLDKDGVEDYEISSRVQKDVTSITSDLSDLKIYIPEDLEYSQYSIDGYLRELVGNHIRTMTKLDRDIYVMSVFGHLSESQYYDLVKYLITENEYLVLLDK